MTDIATVSYLQLIMSSQLRSVRALDPPLDPDDYDEDEDEEDDADDEEEDDEDDDDGETWYVCHRNPACAETDASA